MAERLLQPELRVDRVMVTACDVATARLEGVVNHTALAPCAADDAAAVEQAWREAAGWAGAAARLETWARAVAALWTRELERAVAHETIPSLTRAHQVVLERAQSALADLGTGGLVGVWAVADVVAASTMHDYRERWGLSAALAQVCPSGQEPWPRPGEADVLTRPLRYEMSTGREGSDLCLWSLSGPDGERWDAYVDPYELPLPLQLADAYADLAGDRPSSPTTASTPLSSPPSSSRSTTRSWG